MSSPAERIHSMDALRASTMFLLVPVHAANLAAVNGHPGAWATGIFWVVHVFRMPLFFAMSGFFLALMLNLRGLEGTARNRTVRIAVPLLLGLVTLMPLTLFIAQQTGTVTSNDGVPAGSPFTFQPGFLWFLWYLLIIDGVAIALYLGAPRLLRSAGTRFRGLLARPLVGILLLAIPTAAVLWPAPTWTAGGTVDSYVPDPFALAYYVLFFALGATLFVHRELVAEAGRNGWRWAVCALVVAIPAGLLFSFHNSGHGSNPLVHGLGLFTYAVATWASLIALVGLANRYIVSPRPTLRYMADSSYWIYLSHLPAMVLVIGLLAATLGTGPLFVLATAISLAFSLLTYPLFVRYTAIGRVLNGPRERPRRRLRLPFRPALPPAAAIAAIVALLALPAVLALADSPQVFEIQEPALGAAPLNPADVHMVAAYVDADGDDHLCSDWEIWSVSSGEPVWEAHCAVGQEKVHIHLGDGTFVNSHAGRTELLPDTEYELRVRFRDDSGEVDEWSEWETRQFETIPTGSPGDDAPVPWAVRDGYMVEVVASGFQLPVDIAMVPEPGLHPGDPLLYVAELYGAVKVVTRDGSVHDYATGLLNFNPTGNFPGSGEMGLGSIAIEPGSGDLLASLVYEASGAEPKPHYPKVIRLHSDERGLAAEAQSTVLDMAGETQGASHQISNLTFSPEGDLFVHNGDGGVPETGQDLDSFRGKVLLMTPGGDPVSTNPFYDAGNGITARDYIYSYGHRNAFGGTWRLADEAQYAVENGPNIDRLVRLEPGENYQWPDDESMSHGALYNWNPAHAPVQIEFLEPQRFGGSGFPDTSLGHAFVTESGSTYASGSQTTGKRIVEFEIEPAGGLRSGPTTLVEYSGAGKATAVGLAAGTDGLYFTDLYKDSGASSPIDPGANVLRVSFCGEECPLPDVALESKTPPSGEPSHDGVPPVVSRFRMRRTAFAVGGGRGATSAAAKHGTAFLYSLSEPASVRIRVRPLDVGGGPGGVLSGTGRSGSNRLRFDGLLGRRRLSSSRYVATIRARDDSGNRSNVQRTRFRVVRRGP
jgi:glucose/arabinose dehydrogenase/surface polysaccharide O-acyltransferase-like enzyme